jgi:calcineurin-like phosphoesterase family protein
MKFDKQNIFFTSDFHIGHHNVIKFDGRPFENVDEMHNTLIERWNSVVTDNDIVYYLGDLSFGRDELTKWFVSQLKGEIIFILGNHDKLKDIQKLDRFSRIHEYGTEIFIKDDELPFAKRNSGYQQIILSHYPILSWNKGHHGSWHLHGHCHQNLSKSFPDYYARKVIDVGCNGHNYTPLSYSDVKKIMSEKEEILIV